MDHYAKVLGIQTATLTAAVINDAWKIKMKQAHPDKNQGTAAATAATQLYNAARNALLDRLEGSTRAERQAEKQAREDEEERKAAGSGSVNKAGRRVHRSIGSHPAGRQLVEEMRQHFSAMYHFTDSSKCRVSSRDIMDGFIKSRASLPPTKLETNMFKRHYKRLFAEVIQGVAYAKYKDRRCFTHVAKRDVSSE
jgi:curved DNA-binding protein CbpA